MQWIPATTNPANPGVYWVQSRSELAHLQIRYHSLYWNGHSWNAEPGSGVYYWAAIEKAPEFEGAMYYDELGRIDNVARQEKGVDLQTLINS